MRVVISVHGIATEGKWQDPLGKLFRPHFGYCAVKYKQYRHLGVLKLIFDPIVLLGAGLSLIFLYLRGYQLQGMWALSTVILVLAGSHLGARLRRELAMREVKSQVDIARKGGRKPHLIAHSFGSYLTGRALRRYPDLLFDHVIFAGSVLSSKYDWESILKERQAFRQLRNEIALRDLASRMAYFLEGLVPGMGHSGFSGFQVSEGVVHTVEGPYSECPRCLVGSNAVRVHNVPNAALSHSDHVFSIGYAERFWLPYLWGFHPSRYADFLDFCEDLITLEESGAMAGLHRKMKEFRHLPWMVGDSMLGEYVSSELAVMLGEVAPVRDLWWEAAIENTLRNIWHAVSIAQRELNGNTSGDCKLIQAINPVTAVYRALSATLTQESHECDANKPRNGRISGIS